LPAAALGGVFAGGDDVCPAVREGPDQDARLGLFKVPSAGLFCPVVPAAERYKTTVL